MLRKPKVGIALGSGAARGWAHIGVLQTLEKAGIPVDIVTGTSAGGVVGSFYAANALDTLQEILQEFKGLRNSLSYMDFTFSGNGLIAGKRLIQFLQSHLPARTFADLKKPFGVVAVDLNSHEEVHIFQGALLPAIRATIAVPGFLSVVKSGDMNLVDGGILNPVPVSLARKLGAEIVIGVDLESVPRSRDLDNMTDVIHVSMESMQERIRTVNRQIFPADVWLEPQLNAIRFMDYHKTEEAIAEGIRVAEKAIPDINRLLANPIERMISDLDFASVEKAFKNFYFGDKSSTDDIYRTEQSLKESKQRADQSNVETKELESSETVQLMNVRDEIMHKQAISEEKLPLRKTSLLENLLKSAGEELQEWTGYLLDEKPDKVRENSQSEDRNHVLEKKEANSDTEAKKAKTEK